MTMHELPPSERPRERCLQQGPQALSLRECLALLIGGSGKGRGSLEVAQNCLELPGEGMSEGEQERAFFTALEDGNGSSLERVAGLGPVARTRLLAAFELGRRYERFRSSEVRAEGPRLRPGELPSRALDAVTAELRHEPREWLGFVPIYRSGRCGQLCLVARGLRTHVHTDAMELFSRVLALRPQAIFLFHNHPSGDLTPSPQDLDLTREVEELCRRLGLRLLGHGIVHRARHRWIVL